ncbi:MAG: MinD/ParA family protein [Calditerricola sp.]|nr:MinD/ParA family protein [Calditerricola sp.]
MRDQAEPLRERMRRLAADAVHPQAAAPASGTARVLAVTSGKGGVGKSNVALNVALALARAGKRVVLVDSDIGFANLDVLMGIAPRFHLLDLVRRRLSVWDVLTEGPEGIRFLAGGSGVDLLLSLEEEALGYLFSQLEQLEEVADVVLFDTGAGLSSHGLRVLQAADDILLVTTPEPTALTDAYALVKLLVQQASGGPGLPSFAVWLIVNRVRSRREGEEVARRLVTVAQRFLNLSIAVLGWIPEDDHVRRAVQLQQPLLVAYPYAPAAKEVARIARTFADGDAPAIRRPGGIRQFLHRLFNRL